MYSLNYFYPKRVIRKVCHTASTYIVSIEEVRSQLEAGGTYHVDIEEAMSSIEAGDTVIIKTGDIGLLLITPIKGEICQT